MAFLAGHVAISESNIFGPYQGNFAGSSAGPGKPGDIKFHIDITRSGVTDDERRRESSGRASEMIHVLKHDGHPQVKWADGPNYLLGRDYVVVCLDLDQLEQAPQITTGSQGTPVSVVAVSRDRAKGTLACL